MKLSHLINEIQKVYFRKVYLLTETFKVIVRQMTRKVVVQEGGDSTLLPNELIDIKRLDEENKALLDQNKPQFHMKAYCLNYQISLNTESFISASSFQETARVLTGRYPR